MDQNVKEFILEWVKNNKNCFTVLELIQPVVITPEEINEEVNQPIYKIGDCVVHISPFNNIYPNGKIIPEYIVIISTNIKDKVKYNGILVESDLRLPTKKELKKYFIS
jgi:hypothetical protein